MGGYKVQRPDHNGLYKTVIFPGSHLLKVDRQLFFTMVSMSWDFLLCISLDKLERQVNVVAFPLKIRFGQR